MLHIIKQYKQLFIQFIMNSQVGGAEGLSADVEKAVKSSDILTLTEYKALLEKYGDDEEGLNKAVSEGIKDQLYRDGRVLKILKKYYEMHQSVIEETSEQADNLRSETGEVEVGDNNDSEEEIIVQEEKESVINTDIFTRTLKKGVTPGADVMALQDFLIQRGYLKATYKNKKGEEISSADGKFGNGTKNALKKFQKELGYANPDGVLTVSKTKTYKTLKAIKALNGKNDYKGSYTNIYARKATKKEVKDSIDRSGKSLEALNNLNKHSDEFYKALEAYIDGGFRDDTISDMGALFGWLKEAVGANNADDYFEKMKTYKDKLDGKEDKFNEELLKLLPKRKDSKGHEYNERQYSLGKYALRDIIIMAAFQDLPIVDIRFNFAKNLVSNGISMDKAKALKDWVDGGMEGKPNYKKEHLEKISGSDSLTNLRSLRSTLTAYGFSQRQIDSTLAGDLSTLTKKQKKVLNTIINDRIIPDLETLRIGGFNFIERWFDEKDGQIKNGINRLTGNKHELGTIKEILGKGEEYKVSLEKIGGYYILSIDDWGGDSKMTFKSLPSKSKIKDALQEYTDNNLKFWKNESYVSVNYSVSEQFLGKSNPEDPENFEYYKISDSKYIVTKDGEYIELDHKPTQEEINKFYDSGLKGFEEIHTDGYIDNNLSIGEKLRITGDIIKLLKIQDTEGGFYGTEDGLTEGIQRVDSRYEFTKGIADEFLFAKKAISILEIENKELFKRFSIMSVFASVNDLLKAFPTSEKVEENILKLLDTNGPEEYRDVLVEINQIKEVREYFDIISNAYKGNNNLNKWKKYRLRNIHRQTGLKRVNDSVSRQFKYGEALPVNATAEDALKKMKSETTDKGGDYLSINILGNIVAGLILKAGITDITEEDLENAINNKWESIPLKDFKRNIINTARNKRISADQITSSLGLQKERGDTHVFHTVIEKEVTLFKKTGEKVTVKRVYDIYLRPECNNVLIIPDSNGIVEKLNPADFNMDISSLKTSTLPISLLMLKGLADSVSGDGTTGGGTGGTDGNPSSVPVDGPVTGTSTAGGVVPPL